MKTPERIFAKLVSIWCQIPNNGWSIKENGKLSKIYEIE